MAPPRHKIRLTCKNGCGREEDGTLIMSEIRREGWTDVFEARSYEDSMGDPKLGEDMFDWFTHEGCCPDCTKEESDIIREFNEKCSNAT